MTNDSEPDVTPQPADTAEVLKRLQDSALGLLAGLDRAPRSLRIKADQVEIEVEWPDVQVGPAPAALAGAEVVHAAGNGTGVAAAADAGTGMYVLAHTVGVFYRSREPGAEPFVRSGDVITPGQQLGIIEAMKLMIPVESDVTGRIVEVLVSDGTPVEYGDRLFAFEPVSG